MTCEPCCLESMLIETDMRTMVCTKCGGETFGSSFMGPMNPWGMELRPSQTYTREKRFRKYLQRASRQQSIGSVPEETWQYLLARRPFQGPKHIVLTLKHARNLHKKCYDRSTRWSGLGEKRERSEVASQCVVYPGPGKGHRRS